MEPAAIDQQSRIDAAGLPPTLAAIAERIIQIDERSRFPYETVVRLGRHFPDADKAFFSGTYDWTIGSRLYFLRDVVFDTQCGVLYHDGRPLADHPLDQPTRDSLTGVDPARLETLDDDACVVLGVHRFRGYHHWLMTDVPALAHGTQHAPPGAILLCPPLQPYQHEYLDLLGLAGMPRREVEPRQQYFLPRAIMTDFHLLQNVFQISVATLQTFALLRRRTPIVETPARVYISRGNAAHRRVLNEDRLQPLLRQYGYTSVRLERLSLPMQINVFRNARCIVAPHGAGLTNLGFGGRGTHVFELLGEGWVNACFNVMAKAMRMHYWADVYPSSGSATPISADMTVDLESFEQHLAAIDAHVAATAAFDTMYNPPETEVLV